VSAYDGLDRPPEPPLNAVIDQLLSAGAGSRPTSGRERTRMSRWRYWLFRCMQRHEYPEWRALGLPADRVITIDVSIEK
jgi:hypothetical protein